MIEDEKYTSLNARQYAPYECDVCGAIVDRQAMEQHDAWHVAIADIAMGVYEILKERPDQ